MSQERVWTINVGGNNPYLWVEVNGTHYKTYSQQEPRRVRAKHDDGLSLFNSPGWDTNSRRTKGTLVAQGRVDQFAYPDEPEENG